MMLRADTNNLIPDDSDGAKCPSLIDLAAFADDRLGEEKIDRIAAHIAGCESCMQIMAGLHVDIRAIDDESRLLLVPASVIESARGLRTSESVAAQPERPMRIESTWMAYVRRGAALAACAAIAGAGYRIGDSFTEPAAPSGETLIASAQGFDFGLLEAAAVESADADGLFAMALAGSAAAKEGTP